MANKTYAKEWLSFAIKNLNTAKLLYKVNHYEDIIGVELQQALEKILKAIFANENIKIQKDHDLVKLYYTIEQYYQMEDDEIVWLKIASDYYKEDRYPNPNYSLPPRDEVKKVLDFTDNFFQNVCNLLDINQNDFTK